METIGIILLTIGSLGIPLLIWYFMCYKNYEAYKLLPSFDRMLWSFRPVNKFVEEAESKNKQRNWTEAVPLPIKKIF